MDVKDRAWLILLTVIISQIGSSAGGTSDLCESGDFAEVKNLITRDPNDPTKLAVVETSLAWLTHTFTEPVDVISVLGGYHTGKSFLLNQLTGMGTDGFRVTDSVDPTTTGIQMTTSVLGDQQVLWLDTEGFAAAENSGDYDAKLFAVAAKLSSHLLYNSLSNINQNDISYLEQLARRAQLFSMKAGATDTVGGTAEVANSTDLVVAASGEGALAVPGRSAGEFALSLPPLWWIVQSFHMRLRKGETPLQWLDRMLDESVHAIGGETSTLKAIFTERHAHTLYFPTPSDKPEAWETLHSTPSIQLNPTYREQLGALQDALLSAVAAAPAKGGAAHRKRTGREIADLVRTLVDGANSGAMATLPSLWQMMIEAQVREAADEASDAMQRQLAALVRFPPLTSAEFGVKAKAVVGFSLKAYSDALFGLRYGVVETRAKRLVEALEKLRSAAELANDNSIREVIAKGREAAVDAIKAKFKALVFPQPRVALDQELAAIQQIAVEVLVGEASRDYGKLLETGKKELLNQVDALGRGPRDANDAAIEKLFDGAKEKAMKAFHDKMKELKSAQDKEPKADSCHVYTEYAMVEDAARALGVEAYEANIVLAADEKEAKEKRAALKSDLTDAAGMYVKWESECVTRRAEAMAEALARKRLKEDYEVVLRQATPMNEKDLSATMDKKEKEDAAALDKAFAPFISSDHSTKPYKAAVARGQEKLREGLARARARMVKINLDAWARFVDGPLEEAARRIRDYANAASPIFSPLSNFRFRSWAKALALEEVMSRAGADRVPRAQLEGVFDEWLGGNLDVSSSGEMRKIVEARESYASVFLALALGAAALRGVQLQSRKNSGG